MILSFASQPPAGEPSAPAPRDAMAGGAMGFYRTLLAELRPTLAAPANENCKDDQHDRD